MFARGPSSRAPISVGILCLALASPAVKAQSHPDRSQLVSMIAGTNPAMAADLTRILSAGSRGWEPCLSAPMVVEQTAPDGQRRSFYFALEAGFLAETPHLPTKPLEKMFAREVDSLLQKEGPAPWPIYVFSGRGSPEAPLDSVSLATTVRILARTGDGAFQAASAIVLNSPFWSASPELSPDDAYTAMVARHELYHARRAWTRASAIAATADAIETAFGAAEAPSANRAMLESLVSQALIAGEEVAAIDRSVAAPGISSSRRFNALEYRERNVKIEDKLATRILELFPSLQSAARSGEARKRVVRIFRAAPGE
jgi:hypothetical protein